MQKHYHSLLVRDRKQQQYLFYLFCLQVYNTPPPSRRLNRERGRTELARKDGFILSCANRCRNRDCDKKYENLLTYLIKGPARPSYFHNQLLHDATYNSSLAG